MNFINWSNLSFLFFGALGAFVLLLLQEVISRMLPKFPWQADESLRQVRQATADGDYEGDADIYNLDRALMDAELERPGSTLRLYYNQPPACFSRLLGSILVSFTVTGWVLGEIHSTCLPLLVLLFGISLLLYPYMTWNMSRPRLKE